jgi:hypothetical protein
VKFAGIRSQSPSPDLIIVESQVESVLDIADGTARPNAEIVGAYAYVSDCGIQGTPSLFYLRRGWREPGSDLRLQPIAIAG